MKHVLIIAPFFSPNIGGVETRLDDICAELDKRGYAVTVLTYQPLITKAWGKTVEKKGNLHIYRFWWIGFDLFHKLKPFPLLQAFYICPVLFLVSFFYLFFKYKRIDVIHATGFNAALIARILRLFFKKRWVVSTEAIYELEKDSVIARLVKWILYRADILLTLSEPSRQELIDIGLDGRKIVNQISWVDQENFKPLDKTASRAKTGLKNNFTVLFIGRLLEIKGVRDLSRVAEETPFIDYVFIGDGFLSGFLKEKAQKCKNLFYLSRIENRNLPVYYNSADIFIMPSQYKEGLGRVVAEALSCGIPVVASKLGGLSYILDDSVALMIEPTKENIKTALMSLYDNPEQLTLMRKNAREFALKHFNSGNCEVIIRAYNFN